MASKDRQPVVDEGGPSVPDWMITFSDCMTLLLTFFVLLLSFSSFDEASLSKLDGAFRVDHEKPTLFTEAKRRTPKPCKPFDVLLAVLVIDIDTFSFDHDHWTFFQMKLQIGIWVDVVCNITVFR